MVTSTRKFFNETFGKLSRQFSGRRIKKQEILRIPENEGDRNFATDEVTLFTATLYSKDIYISHKLFRLLPNVMWDMHLQSVFLTAGLTFFSVFRLLEIVHYVICSSSVLVMLNGFIFSGNDVLTVWMFSYFFFF